MLHPQTYTTSFGGICSRREKGQFKMGYNPACAIASRSSPFCPSPPSSAPDLPCPQPACCFQQWPGHMIYSIAIGQAALVEHLVLAVQPDFWLPKPSHTLYVAMQKCVLLAPAERCFLFPPDCIFFPSPGLAREWNLLWVKAQESSGNIPIIECLGSLSLWTLLCLCLEFHQF